jgi:hypothetical protein
MDSECLRLVARVIYDLDLPGFNDEELHVMLANGEERLPVPVQLGLGMGAASQLAYLHFIKGRECD